MYSTNPRRICTGREPSEEVFHVTHVVCSDFSVLSGSSGRDDNTATVLKICPLKAVLFQLFFS
jgi:hypothetical protein